MNVCSVEHLQNILDIKQTNQEFWFIDRIVCVICVWYVAIQTCDGNVSSDTLYYYIGIESIVATIQTTKYGYLHTITANLRWGVAQNHVLNKQIHTFTARMTYMRSICKHFNIYLFAFVDTIALHILVCFLHVCKWNLFISDKTF